MSTYFRSVWNMNAQYQWFILGGGSPLDQISPPSPPPEIVRAYNVLLQLLPNEKFSIQYKVPENAPEAV